MSKSLALVMTLLLVVSLQSLGLASTQIDPVKWSQTPDMVNGYEFSSEVKVPSIVADDWICPDGRPVTDIHWWGSYWTPAVSGQYGHFSDGRPSVSPPGNLESFTIDIWSNVPKGGAEPYSRPGSILKSYSFNYASVHEVFFGTTGSGRSVYQYFVDLPQGDWFNQEQGVTYWLSIKANLPCTLTQWGWHESNEHNASAAVQDFKGAGWLQIQNNEYDNDMAFELTTIPEPASLSVLGVGFSGMAALLFRRRR